MLPFTAGARPGKRNIIFLPNSASSRLLPERNPSPTPTSSNNDPTPQAIPNMVRNERSLCAHRLRKICAKMSKTVRMIQRRLYILLVSRAVLAIDPLVVLISLTAFAAGDSIRPLGPTRFTRQSVPFKIVNPGCQRPTSLSARAWPQADPPAQHAHTCKGGPSCHTLF